MQYMLLLFLLSFSTFAAKWDQLTVGETYRLLQNFKLSQFERSQSYVDFTRGDKFRLKKISSIDIPGSPLDLFTFDYQECPGMDLVTDLEIIPVKGTLPVVEVGAEVVDCELLIYLERRDFFNKSLFE
jgi:hypothetical protein